ncbi:MFS transporter [Streptomyces sp. NPDC005925]|uniref:MFS transporter n=1 Tax=Streptomyces sp. NPDC005925 TaxID=3157172 RepID=UPI0033D573DA
MGPALTLAAPLNSSAARSRAALLVASAGALSSFHLLLAALPSYVAHGGAGGAGAGVTTGVTMLATVLMELAAPRLLAAYGSRAVLAAGVLLLGLPAVLLAAGPPLWLVLTVCAARGAGLGAVVVAGTGLAAALAPPGRRARSLGGYGLALGVPAVVGLPLGVWAGERAGFTPVFLAAAALGLPATAAALALPGRVTRPARPSPDPSAVPGSGRMSGQTAPALVLGAMTLAAGVISTFLPLTVPEGEKGLAATALLVQAATAPLARVAAGWFGDRYGSGRLLVPALLAAALGTAALARPDVPALLLAGAGLFGVGYGLGQNATLAVMFERAPRAAYDRVSALWNLAFDAGMGVGAVAFGFAVGDWGHATGFVVTALVVLCALVPALAGRSTSFLTYFRRRRSA